MEDIPKSIEEVKAATLVPNPMTINEEQTKLIGEFASTLYKYFSLEKKTSKEEKMYQHLKVKDIDTESLYLSFPVYQKWQACYGVNSFIEHIDRDREVFDFNYSTGQYCTPEFSEIEIKREKYKTCLSFGWIFFKYKGAGFAIQNIYRERDAASTLYFDKKDRAIASSIVSGIKEYMKEHNFLKGEKLKIVNGAFLEFLEYPKLDLNDVILDEKIKDEIFLNLVYPMNNEEICKKYSLPWKRGVLLGGEPGTGKTKLAKVLCNLVNTTVIWVTAESIRQPYEVKTVFEAARYLAPTLLIFEDIDFLGADREVSNNPILGELLNQMDGNSPNHGIFMLASSNRPGILDKALANRPGRFDAKIEIPKPNLRERMELSKLFSKNKVMYDGYNPEEIARITDGLTGAHLQEVFIYATMNSLRDGFDVIQKENLMKAISRCKENNTNILSR
jgi:ATP-dependent 26S proteasome regulatory subunit